MLRDIISKFQESYNGIEKINNSLVSFIEIFENLFETLKSLERYIDAGDAAAKFTQVCSDVSNELKIVKTAGEEITNSVVNFKNSIKDALYSINRMLSELKNACHDLNSYRDKINNVMKNINDIKKLDLEYLEMGTNIEKQNKELIIEVQNLKNEIKLYNEALEDNNKNQKKENSLLYQEMKKITDQNKDLMGFVMYIKSLTDEAQEKAAVTKIENNEHVDMEKDDI